MRSVPRQGGVRLMCELDVIGEALVESSFTNAMPRKERELRRLLGDVVMAYQRLNGEHERAMEAVYREMQASEAVKAFENGGVQ